MLEEIMKAAGIEVFGVADYEDTLPETGFKQKDRVEDAKSVIVCLIPWDTGRNEGRNMARYAVGRDYHAVAAEHLSVAAEILRGEEPPVLPRGRDPGRHDLRRDVARDSQRNRLEDPLRLTVEARRLHAAAEAEARVALRVRIAAGREEGTVGALHRGIRAEVAPED